MLEDPQYQAREAITAIDHPRWSGLKMQNVFPRLSRTPGSIRSLAPQEIGQDNAAIYGELGIDADQLAAYRAENVI